MGEPEIRGWDEDEEYIITDNRKRSKSKDRFDRPSPDKSRSRYKSVQYLHLNEFPNYKNALFTTIYTPDTC